MPCGRRHRGGRAHRASQPQSKLEIRTMFKVYVGGFLCVARGGPTVISDPVLVTEEN